MARQTPFEDDPLFTIDFDLGQIFIGREQQLDLFHVYLERWLRQMATDSSSSNIVPSPNNKLQGLVILLHGRGGFGKSVLLKRYHEITLSYGKELSASTIIDWEFAVSGRRALFSPAPGEEVDMSQYFSLLRDQLVIALKKRSDEFKNYQSAVKDVGEARKRVRAVLDNLQKDSHYAWLRGLAGEGVLALVRLIPHSQVLLDQANVAEKIKEIVGEGAQIGIEQVRQVWTKLHDNLGIKLNDYLEQAIRLGQGIGRDLAHFAKRKPLLIFFDTYEEIDEADELLRIVMGAAGGQVGWILAGRDNLWAGLSQRLRSQDTIYGYKDLVFYNRGLSVDFSADGVGDFTLSDIQEYFAQLSKIPCQFPLPPLSEKDAEHLLSITKGVPLAVKIAASLYLEKPSLELLLEGTDGKREIVDQMVRRYLIHTRTNEADKARLYGLALLRRAEEPRAIATALDLPPSTTYNTELNRLHRRYGFVFTKQGQPSLHQEVRYFMRMWLLEHYNDPEVVLVNQRLEEVYQSILQDIEAVRQYASIQARLEDEQWVQYYLDLAEQHFWRDPARGVAFLLPFMLAAGIYRREANREAFKIGMFFESVMHQPYRRHWEWAAHSLRYTTSHNPLPDELAGLKDLVKLASLTTLTFVPPLPNVQKELEAALWCRLGEAYRGKQEEESLYWYTKAINQLLQEIKQNEEYIRTLLDVVIEEKQNDVSTSGKASKDAVNGLRHERLPDWPYRGSQLTEAATNLPNRDAERRQRLKYTRRVFLVGGTISVVIMAGTGIFVNRLLGSLSPPRPTVPRSLPYSYTLHTGSVESVAWSPDGKRIASAGDDHIVLVWDPMTSNTLLTYAKHTSYVVSVAWSPDGKYIASAGGDKTVQVWDSTTSETLFTYTSHTAAVGQVAWSPDGKYIASARGDKTVQMWDLTTRETLFTYTKYTGAMWRVVWSPDGKYIALAGDDTSVQIWSLTTDETVRTYTKHTDYVQSVSWSPDGKRIASAGRDATVQVWNPTTGETLLTYLRHTNYVLSVAWSHNGKYIASAGDDTTVQVWNSTTGETVLTYTKHTAPVESVAWSPDSKRIASAGDDTTVQIWSPTTGTPLLIYAKHTASVKDVGWSPDGKYIASAGADGTTEVWDPTTGNTLLTYTKQNTDVVESVAWSPDGKRIASADNDTTVQVWDVTTGETVRTYTKHTNFVQSVSWSPDGKRIASGGRDTTVQVWNSTTGETVLTYTKHTNFVQSVAWSPDGKYIASAGDDTTVQVWDSTTGETVRTYTKHTAVVGQVAWSPDGKRIASASNDTTVQVWDSATGNTLRTYTKHTGFVWTVAWSPDGKRIASGGRDATVQVWDTTTGNHLFTYLRHTAIIWTVVWSPDGKRIASAGDDRTVQVWCILPVNLQIP